MGRDDDARGAGALGRAAGETVALAVIDAALGRAGGTAGGGEALHAGADTLPGADLLRQERQLAALAGSGLLRPEAQFGEATRLLGGHFAARTVLRSAEPAVQAEIASAPGQVGDRQAAAQPLL